MKRVVDTSVGRVVLDFYGDSWMQVSLLDLDGWEVKEGEWEEGAVADALFYLAGVPEDEAQRIERETRSQRPELRAKRESRSFGRWSVLGPAVLALLILPWLIGFVFVLWLFYTHVP